MTARIAATAANFFMAFNLCCLIVLFIAQDYTKVKSFYQFYTNLAKFSLSWKREMGSGGYHQAGLVSIAKYSQELDNSNIISQAIFSNFDIGK